MKAGIDSASWMCSASTSIPASRAGSKNQPGASVCETRPSIGTSTRRNASGGSASGGTIITGFGSVLATAEAVPPERFARRRRPASTDRESDDVARPARLDEPLDDWPLGRPKRDVRRLGGAACRAIAVGLHVQRLHLGVEERRERARGLEQGLPGEAVVQGCENLLHLPVTSQCSSPCRTCQSPGVTVTSS